MSTNPYLPPQKPARHLTSHKQVKAFCRGLPIPDDTTRDTSPLVEARDRAYLRRDTDVCNALNAALVTLDLAKRHT